MNNRFSEDGRTPGAIPADCLDFDEFGTRRPNGRWTHGMTTHWVSVIAQMEQHPHRWVRVLVAKDSTQRPGTLKKDRRISYSSRQRPDGLYDIYAMLKPGRTR